MKYLLFLILFLSLLIPNKSFGYWYLQSDSSMFTQWTNSDNCTLTYYPGSGAMGWSTGSMGGCDNNTSQSAVDSAFLYDNSILPTSDYAVSEGLLFSAQGQCADDGVTPWSQFSTCGGGGTSTPATSTPLTDYTLDFGVGILIVMASILFSGMVFNYMTDKERVNNQEII